MRSCRRSPRRRSRTQSSFTIARDSSLVRSRAFRMSVPPPERSLAHDQEELEASEEEVEAPRPVLPERRPGAIVMTGEDARIHGAEGSEEKMEQPESYRRVETPPVLVADDPGEHSRGHEDSRGFPRDPAHLDVEPFVLTRETAETSGLPGVLDVVRVGRVDDHQGRHLILEGQGSGIGPCNLSTSGHQIERCDTTSQRASDVFARAGARPRGADQGTHVRITADG